MISSAVTGVTVVSKTVYPRLEFVGPLDFIGDSAELHYNSTEAAVFVPASTKEAEEANKIVFEAGTLPSESDSLEASNALPSSVIWDVEFEHKLMHGRLLKKQALDAENGFGEDMVMHVKKRCLCKLQLCRIFQ